MPTALIKIEYTGSEASCIIEVDETAGTITSSVGNAGAEAPDANFGVAGVIDISAAAYDTVGEIVDAVDGYTDYSAELISGLTGYSCDGVSDQYLQAKSFEAFVPITVTSVIDSSIALVTWERVQEDLDFLAENQTSAEHFINTASKMATNHTGRVLKAADYTEYLPGNGLDFIVFPQFPINSVTAVKLDSARVFGSDTEVSSDDYDLDDDAGIIHLLETTTTEARKTVYVEYNAGYSTIPEDLQNSIVECVGWLFRRLKSGSIGVKSESSDGGSLGSEIGIPFSIRNVWDRYKNRRF